MAAKGKATARVADKDLGLQELVQRLAKRNKNPMGIVVGLVGAKAQSTEEGSDLTIAELGAIHEFGLGVPQRSFLRDWYDETEQAHKEQFREMAKKLVKREDKADGWEQGLNRLGVLYVAEIQARIKKHIPPPLAPATIKAKGSDVPLIDKGILWTSITYELRPCTPEGKEKGG